MRVLGIEVHRTPPPSPYGELRRLFELLDVDHVVDVGANRGQYVDAIRSVGFGGAIDCIEPQPDCAADLRRRGDVTVHEVALGSASGRADFRVYRDDSLSSLHRLNDFGRSVWSDAATADEVGRIEVRMSTFDELFSSVPLGNRVWLKIDTQGHDLEVLNGVSALNGRIVGIQSEVAFTGLYDDAPTPWEHIAVLSSRGFSLAGLAPIGRVDGGAITEADCLFVRAGAAAGG